MEIDYGKPPAPLEFHRKRSPSRGCLKSIEVFVFFIFCGFTMAVAYLRQNGELFYHLRVLNKDFRMPPPAGIGLDDIFNIDDVFMYLRDTAIPTFVSGTKTVEPFGPGAFLIGYPTMRTVNLNPDEMERTGYYSEDLEAKEDYESFTWMSSVAPAENGRISQYGRSGYPIQMPYDNVEKGREILQMLKDVQFVQNSTRALILDAYIFDGRTQNLFFFRWVFEFPPTGGAFPKLTISPFDLGKYNSSLISITDGLFAGCILFFFVIEAVELFKEGKKFFMENILRHLFNLFFIALGCVVLVFCYRLRAEANLVYNEMVTELSIDVGLTDLEYLNSSYEYTFSCFIFLAVLKVFIYIGFTRTTYQLTMAIEGSRGELIAFFTMLSIVIFMYSLFGTLFFHAKIENYSSIPRAIVSVTRMLLGDFDYQSLAENEWFFGPFFFCSFSFFVLFILMNLLLTILGYFYTRVRTQMELETKPSPILNWIRVIAIRKEIRTWEEYVIMLQTCLYKDADIFRVIANMDLEMTEEISHEQLEAFNLEMEELLERQKELKNETAENSRIEKRLEYLDFCAKEHTARLTELHEVVEKWASLL